jgi:hypothetical protein
MHDTVKTNLNLFDVIYRKLLGKRVYALMMSPIIGNCDIAVELVTLAQESRSYLEAQNESVQKLSAAGVVSGSTTGKTNEYVFPPGILLRLITRPVDRSMMFVTVSSTRNVIEFVAFVYSQSMTDLRGNFRFTHLTWRKGFSIRCEYPGGNTTWTASTAVVLAAVVKDTLTVATERATVELITTDGSTTARIVESIISRPGNE